ncbi:dirigent protein 24 [Prunus yedoensis var. nudiflora]|uniref:Dirigent protein n=1 Tax=Prunus yedoensis var. nudiflora TaxID=2094558 RepID=A0A314UQP5_PRUYE|nr:dirigent protein 24 [Prunus yedoensis var. nudiflora]
MAKSLLSTSKPLRATLYILVLAIILGHANSARILDEALPEASNPLPTPVPTSNPQTNPTTSLPSGQIPTIAPTSTTVDDTEDDADSPIPETDVAPPVVPPVTTVPEADSPQPETEEPATVPAPIADVAPVAGVAPGVGPAVTSPSTPIPVTTPVADPIPTSPTGPTTPSAAAASATVVKPGAENPHLSFFMHDILGGSHPSVRVVTGLVASTVFNPAFSKANNNIFPVSGGTPLTNNNINGFLNNNKNNIPGIAGLTGLTNSQSSTVIQNSGNNNVVSGGSSQPFVTAGQLPTGTTLQKLMFGSVTVIDDELTEGHELGSAVLGKAQGFYLASSLDGNSHTMAFTVLLHGAHDEVEDTISLFGVHRTASPVSHIAVIGGTGKYEMATGYAAIESLHQEDQHTTDGVDTIMQISVYLSE